MRDASFYEFTIKDHLSAEWADWFDGLEITYHSEGATTLCGCLPDQAALSGALKKINALNLTLISMKRFPPPQLHEGF